MFGAVISVLSQFAKLVGRTEDAELKLVWPGLQLCCAIHLHRAEASIYLSIVNMLKFGFCV